MSDNLNPCSKRTGVKTTNKTGDLETIVEVEQLKRQLKRTTKRLFYLLQSTPVVGKRCFQTYIFVTDGGTGPK